MSVSVLEDRAYRQEFPRTFCETIHDASQGLQYDVRRDVSGS